MSKKKCDLCEMIFNGPALYIQHYQSKHKTLPPEYVDKELFFCDQCPFATITKNSLTSHVVYGHKNQKQKRVKKEYKCQYCGKVFKCKTNCEEHEKVKHEKSTPFKCDQCEMTWGTFVKLSNHKRDVHNRVKCEICGKSICNEFNLKRHQANVHGIKPKNVLQCEKCPRYFAIQ